MAVELDRHRAQQVAASARSVSSDPMNDWILGVVAPAAGLVAVGVLLVGQLSCLVFGGSWPTYGMAEIGPILAGVVADPGDPGAAWERADSGAQAPGPIAWWLTFLVCAVLAGLVAWRFGPGSRRPAPPAPAEGEWASAHDVRPLTLDRGEEGRLVVGTSGRHRLGVQGRDSLLVVGPAHSGKTTGLSIPALLEWHGPAVVASSKGHLIDETIGWRSRLGDVHVYDPAKATRYPGSGWSPLARCSSWAEALRTAQDLTSGATAAVGTTADRDDLTGTGRGYLWRSSMATALAPFLFAAATSGRTIVDVADWVEREDYDEVLEVLRSVDRSVASTYHATFLHPDEGRSSFLQVMQRILGVYRDPVVAASAARHEIVPAELLDGGDNTLYLTAPEYDQVRLRPLAATIVRQVLAAAYERSAAEGGPIDPPLLLLLDQVVGVAPVEDLAGVASSGAARGVQVVSVFQDVAQIQDHYGAAAPIVKNHRAKLVLPSGHDVDPTVPRARLLSPALAEQLTDGEGALLYGNLAPIRVRGRPWFREADLRERAAAPQETVEPARSRTPGAPAPREEQAGPWLRRRSVRQSADSTAGDPSIPVDEAAFTEIFGSLDESSPDNVTPLSDARRRFRR